MSSTTGTLKSITANQGGFAFTLEWTNPTPPPATLSQSFGDAPAWVRDLLTPNVGKKVTVVTDAQGVISLVTVTV